MHAGTASADAAFQWNWICIRYLDVSCMNRCTWEEFEKFPLWRRCLDQSIKGRRRVGGEDTGQGSLLITIVGAAIHWHLISMNCRTAHVSWRIVNG
jgi:hypothetical protein